MKEQVERSVAELAGKFADKRLHVFDVRVEGVEDGVARLSGRVLERDHIERLRTEIAKAEPGVRVDDSAVTVLRREGSVAVRVVATNLTDLHKEPSFLAEMLTQVLNGVELEVLEERENWCFVRQTDGYMGWVYKGYLAEGTAPAVTHWVVAPTLEVSPEPSPGAQALTRVPAGTGVRVTNLRGDWARVQFAGAMLPAGWVEVAGLRDVADLPLSEDAARRQILADARRYFGVYYLWGGTTPWGTDCSGLAQLVHRMAGYTLPRDCDLQFAAGRVAEFPFRTGDLLYFHSDTNKARITHVGIATGEGWRIVHSSRAKNGVYEEDVQANENLKKSFAGARTFVGQ